MKVGSHDKVKNETAKVEKVKVEKEEKNLEKNNKSRKTILICVSTLIVLALILCISMGFAIINQRSTTVMAGVTVEGIEIKGLTKEESINKIKDELKNQLSTEIKITSENFEYGITPEQIETQYKVEEAVEQAYKIGREGNIFNKNFSIVNALCFGKEIELKTEYNEELLEQIVQDINVKIPNALVETSHYIEGENLIIKKGTAGNTVDTEKLKQLIIEKIENHNNEPISIELIYTQPQEIDIEKIHEEVCQEPKDAYYTKEPFEIFTHVEGVDFDVEKAKEILKEEKDEYEIPLIKTMPEVTINEIGTEAFPDLLGSFSTKYNAGQTDRTTNLRLAAEKINGEVVMPGETFSYNETLGERTVAKGYKEAAGFAGGKVVQTLAGGICQISTTLYDAVVYANLEIVERRNHAFLTSYAGAGRDATVVYGAIDFKFKNTRDYPIMIKASVKNGTASVQIFGIKEETEYEVELETKILSTYKYTVKYEDDKSLKEGKEVVSQNGMNGCKSITYKVLKKDGVEVSREVLSSDTYDALTKIIKRGVPEEKTEQKAEKVEKEEKQENETKEETTAKEEKPVVKQEDEKNDEKETSSTENEDTVGKENTEKVENKTENTKEETVEEENTEVSDEEKENTEEEEVETEESV